jgi:glutamate/aspartate transport system substrate-binding protein
MNKHPMFCILALSLVLPGAASGQDLAGTLKKIKDNGTIVLGVRESSVPFSYHDDDQKPIGYAVDICRRVVEAVKTRIGVSDLKVEYVPANANNRIPLMANGTIDLECASTSNLEERQKVVAFSITHFVSNIRAIVRKDAPYKTLKDLNGKAIAVIPGMTSLPLLLKYAVDNKVSFERIPGKDVAEAFLLFQTQRAEAFVFDDVLLASMVANSPTPHGYRMLDDTLRSEPNALMMRKDDGPFKELVDATMLTMIKSGELEALYSKWFMQPIPPHGINLNFPISKELRDALANPNDKGV